MATFTYTPDFGSAAAYEPRVRSTQFGDGYSQRVADGINTAVDQYDLRFMLRDDSEAAAILAFLVARAGVEAFDWTPPLAGAAIRCICRSWSRTFDRNNGNTISAKFIRVYEP